MIWTRPLGCVSGLSKSARDDDPDCAARFRGRGPKLGGSPRVLLSFARRGRVRRAESRCVNRAIGSEASHDSVGQDEVHDGGAFDGLAAEERDESSPPGANR